MRAACLSSFIRVLRGRLGSKCSRASSLYGFASVSSKVTFMPGAIRDGSCWRPVTRRTIPLYMHTWLTS